jgi:hypothetical protein
MPGYAWIKRIGVTLQVVSNHFSAVIAVLGWIWDGRAGGAKRGSTSPDERVVQISTIIPSCAVSCLMASPRPSISLLMWLMINRFGRINGSFSINCR